MLYIVTISELKQLKFDFTDEGDVTLLLGVKIDTVEDGTITISQPALTDAILQVLGLENTSTQHQNPAVSPPLHKYEDNDKFDEA